MNFLNLIAIYNLSRESFSSKYLKYNLERFELTKDCSFHYYELREA